MIEQNETLEEWAGARHSKATLALVFTDIVNSTSIGRKLGDDRWIPLVIEHFNKARSLVERENGYLIKVIGDACMVAFRTTPEAFNFAHDLSLDTGTPHISIRTGIHFGHMWIVDNDVYGSAVNLTSRIQHTPRRVGIAISDPVKRDLEGVWGLEIAALLRLNEQQQEMKGFGMQSVWLARSPALLAAERARFQWRAKNLVLS